MYFRLAGTAIGPPVGSGHVTDLDHMSRHDARFTLLLGIAVLVICGAYAANVKGISGTTSANGRMPGQEDYRGHVILARVITGAFALVGTYMIFKSAVVLVG